MRCAICLEDFSDNCAFAQLVCCRQSIDLLCWLKCLTKRATCPFCRAPVFLKECLTCRSSSYFSRDNLNVELTYLKQIFYTSLTMNQKIELSKAASPVLDVDLSQEYTPCFLDKCAWLVIHDTLKPCGHASNSICNRIFLPNLSMDSYKKDRNNFLGTVFSLVSHFNSVSVLRRDGYDLRKYENFSLNEFVENFAAMMRDPKYVEYIGSLIKLSENLELSTRLREANLSQLFISNMQKIFNIDEHSLRAILAQSDFENFQQLTATMPILMSKGMPRCLRIATDCVVHGNCRLLPNGQWQTYMADREAEKILRQLSMVFIAWLPVIVFFSTGGAKLLTVRLYVFFMVLTVAVRHAMNIRYKKQLAVTMRDNSTYVGLFFLLTIVATFYLFMTGCCLFLCNWR